MACGEQSNSYREMSRRIRAAKSDGSAVWTRLAISFVMVIFPRHAAGPGHGKAVIRSYPTSFANLEPPGAALCSFAVGAAAGAGRCRARRILCVAIECDREKRCLRGRAGDRYSPARSDRGVGVRRS